MSKILMIIAPEKFQDIEYHDSKNALTENGHEVITASTDEICHGKLGGEVKTDLLLDQVKEEDYDAVVFIGGPGSYVYFENSTALNLAQKFYQKGKLTCAICAAPGILAHSGILQGKKATCFSGEAELLQKHGAIYTGSSVEKDGNIITADGPSSAKNFGLEISKNL